MMHMSVCICALFPRLETQTRVVLVIDRAEIRKPTNTGQLATSSLVNSAVVVRGREGEPSKPIPVAPGSQPLLLFPREGEAEVLRPMPGPVTLIVPDGNWRQASKVRARVPGLRSVPCVTLPPGEPSAYRLRSEAHPHGLATLEAIARALGDPRGPGEIQAALERVFLAMVERTLWVRGALDTPEVAGGIPEGARARRSAERNAGESPSAAARGRTRGGEAELAKALCRH